MSNKKTYQRKEQKNEFIENLIDLIMENPNTWNKTWKNANGDLPKNGRNNRVYDGGNLFHLYFLSISKGWEDKRFLTFYEINKIGAKINKGEKSNQVMLYGYYDSLTKKMPDFKEINKLPEEARKKYLKDNVRSYLKEYRVWNVNQIEGAIFDEEYYNSLKTEEQKGAYKKYALKPYKEPVGFNKEEEIAYTELVINEVKKDVVIKEDGGGQAFYRPSTDSIHLPKRTSFTKSVDYYSVLFHELGHAIGNEKRVGGLNPNAFFGTVDYAKEELKAELFSVLAGIKWQIDTTGERIKTDEENRSNSISYLDGWFNQTLSNGKTDEEGRKELSKELYSAFRDVEKRMRYAEQTYIKPLEKELEESLEEDLDKDYLDVEEENYERE